MFCKNKVCLKQCIAVVIYSVWFFSSSHKLLRNSYDTFWLIIFLSRMLEWSLYLPISLEKLDVRKKLINWFNDDVAPRNVNKTRIPNYMSEVGETGSRIHQGDIDSNILYLLYLLRSRTLSNVLDGNKHLIKISFNERIRFLFMFHIFSSN